MARRSTIKTEVPKDIKDELNARLVACEFSDYDAQTDWLNSRLSEIGLALKVSRSSLFRYGAEFQEDFERDMSESRQMYEIAKTSLANNQDAEGVVREATIRTMQSRLLRLSIALREAEQAGDDMYLIAETTTKIARAISNLSRADIQSNKYKREIEAHIRQQEREEAAARVETAAKAQGLGIDQVKFWREQVLMGGV